jgi:PleD family two-component response regulator
MLQYLTRSVLQAHKVVCTHAGRSVRKRWHPHLEKSVSGWPSQTELVHHERSQIEGIPVGRDATTVYVIEDQTMMREYFCQTIRDMHQVQLIGHSGDGTQGYLECCRLRPQLVVLDLMLPGMQGLEIARRLK